MTFNSYEESEDKNSSSYMIIHDPFLDRPLVFKIVFYILGSLHLLLSIWMIVAYSIEHFRSFSDVAKKW